MEDKATMEDQPGVVTQAEQVAQVAWEKSNKSKKSGHVLGKIKQAVRPLLLAGRIIVGPGDDIAATTSQAVQPPAPGVTSAQAQVQTEKNLLDKETGGMSPPNSQPDTNTKVLDSQVFKEAEAGKKTFGRPKSEKPSSQTGNRQPANFPHRR